jgi:hypothetical protein
MRVLATSILMALLVVLPQSASAASGTALGVRQDAVLEQKSGKTTLVVGSDIFIGDRVVTDDKGLVQIRFSDRTELVVGPRSSLVIEDYLLREDGSGGKFAINVLNGTFRFVTGGARKDLYEIKTPTGTVGVRGTAFDGNVKPDHSSFLLYHGSIIICNNAGQCVTVSDHCDIGMFDPTQASFLGNAQDLTGENRTSMRGMFQWSVSEADLMGAFRIDGARECLNRAVVNNVPDSLAPTGDGSPPSENGR